MTTKTRKFFSPLMAMFFFLKTPNNLYQMNEDTQLFDPDQSTILCINQDNTTDANFSKGVITGLKILNIFIKTNSNLSYKQYENAFSFFLKKNTKYYTPFLQEEFLMNKDKTLFGIFKKKTEQRKTFLDIYKPTIQACDIKDKEKFLLFLIDIENQQDKHFKKIHTTSTVIYKILKYVLTIQDKKNTEITKKQLHDMLIYIQDIINLFKDHHIDSKTLAASIKKKEKKPENFEVLIKEFNAKAVNVIEVFSTLQSQLQIMKREKFDLFSIEKHLVEISGNKNVQQEDVLNIFHYFLIDLVHMNDNVLLHNHAFFSKFFYKNISIKQESQNQDIKQELQNQEQQIDESNLENKDITWIESIEEKIQNMKKKYSGKNYEDKKNFDTFFKEIDDFSKSFIIKNTNIILDLVKSTQVIPFIQKRKDEKYEILFINRYFIKLFDLLCSLNEIDITKDSPITDKKKKILEILEDYTNIINLKQDNKTTFLSFIELLKVKENTDTNDIRNKFFKQINIGLLNGIILSNISSLDFVKLISNNQLINNEDVNNFLYIIEIYLRNFKNNLFTIGRKKFIINNVVCNISNEQITEQNLNILQNIFKEYELKIKRIIKINKNIGIEKIVHIQIKKHELSNDREDIGGFLTTYTKDKGKQERVINFSQFLEKEQKNIISEYMTFNNQKIEKENEFKKQKIDKEF